MTDEELRDRAHKITWELINLAGDRCKSARGAEPTEKEYRLLCALARAFTATNDVVKLVGTDDEISSEESEVCSRP
jgi:hypothetical protein